MRYMAIAAGFLFAICGCAAVGADKADSGKPPAAPKQKVYEVEVEAPLPENARHPGCLEYRKIKHCKKWQDKRCVEQRPICTKRDRAGNCIQYAARCTKWAERECLEWGVKLVCKRWREDMKRAPAPGATINPSGQ